MEIAYRHFFVDCLKIKYLFFVGIGGWFLPFSDIIYVEIRSLFVPDASSNPGKNRKCAPDCATLLHNCLSSFSANVTEAILSIWTTSADTHETA